MSLILSVSDEDSDDFKVKQPLGRTYPADGDDVVKTNRALGTLGRHRSPIGEITPYTDNALFDGLQTFQKDKGLKVDGLIRPGGETERALNGALRPARRSATDRKTVALGDGVGSGGANRGDDVASTKQALALTGHYPADRARTPSPNADPDFHVALHAFQREHGLKRDGVAFPGGETERTLNERLGQLLAEAAGALHAPLQQAAAQSPASRNQRTKPPRPERPTHGEPPDHPGLSDRTKTIPAATSPDDPAAAKADRSDDADYDWNDKPALTAPKASGLVTKEPVISKGAVRIDFTSPTFGVDGVDYRVSWRPLDADGKIAPAFDAAASDKPVNTAPTVFGLTTTRIHQPPFDNPHGWAVDVHLPPQPVRNGNSAGVDLSIRTPR